MCTTSTHIPARQGWAKQAEAQVLHSLQHRIKTDLFIGLLYQNSFTAIFPPPFMKLDPFLLPVARLLVQLEGLVPLAHRNVIVKAVPNTA